jgi:hypothetical protein
MRIVVIEAGAATVRLTNAELVIVNNALNEVCNGIDVQEFSTRLGAKISEVRALLKEVNSLLARMPPNGSDAPPDP